MCVSLRIPVAPHLQRAPRPLQTVKMTRRRKRKRRKIIRRKRTRKRKKRSAFCTLNVRRRKQNQTKKITYNGHSLSI